MIFGTFDGLHDGHRFFIDSAKKHAGQLIIVVATDGSVLHIKGHLPRFPLNERIVELKSEVPGARVLSGDGWVIFPHVVIVAQRGFEMTAATAVIQNRTV